MTNKYHYLDMPHSRQRIVYDEHGKMVCCMSLKSLEVFYLTGDQCPSDDAVTFVLASHPGAWVQTTLLDAFELGSRAELLQGNRDDRQANFIQR